MLLNEEDMPFTYSGITPDLIFSPYSLPSRMSMSYLLELIAGKVGALGGRHVDGTPFTGESEEELRNELKSYGFRENGVETMYNGITGEEMKVRIFVGDMMYIRLKHFVANKIQWRSRGPIQLLTRQPTEGKSKSGGLRLGEMEKDCFVAYGAALALKERFDSDKISIPVCSKCGLTAVYNVRKKTGYCQIDGEDAPIKLIEVSASFKILLDELKAVGIYPKILLGKKITESTVQNTIDELKPGYIVERHIIDGDIMLFNRQPSLHRLSIMGHYAKVLPYNTLGINPSATLTYNADFDGDEMNIHVLQNEEALAEADMIINIKHNIVSPRHGLPLIGAVQDYISGCAILTDKNTIVDKATVEFLLSAIGIPAPLKKEKYSGREVFSMLLPDDLNFESQSTTYKITNDDDSYVRIKNGKLTTGVIDSATIGKENGSLLQFLFVRYGPDITSRFIDQFSKLSLIVLLKNGMSISMSDFDLPDAAYTKISEVVKDGIDAANDIIKEQDPLLEPKMVSLTNKLKVRVRNVISAFIESKNNNVEAMMNTGAKGSMTNLIPMVGLVGQQLLRDVRISNGFEGRLTSHSKKGDNGLMARGFITSNYKKGLNPVEYFLHAASSREGLMDNVIRTPISGYMQRRLSSALQDLKVKNDLSVRLGNKIIQFKYGEDGIDVSASDKGELKI